MVGKKKVALEETMNMLWKKKHMERETEAHSWSLKRKIEAFWDKNDSFRWNNEHVVKKVEKKAHGEGKRSTFMEFGDKNRSFLR